MGKARYLVRRIIIAILEGRLELWCLVEFPGLTFEGVGFAAPLLGGGEDGRGDGGWEMLPRAEKQ